MNGIRDGITNEVIRKHAEEVLMYNVLRSGIAYGSIGGKVINNYRQGRKSASSKGLSI